MTDSVEQRLLICTSYGRDAMLASQVLEGAGFACCVCKDLAALMHELHCGAGAVLTVEEALPAGASISLGKYLAAQPAWSDIPILVLTKPGGESPWIKGAYERLGNLTLLERPVRAPTLISAARSALRARQRQYDMRLADQRKDEFLAMLAHELRNPLAPVSAAAALLEVVAMNSAKVRQCSAIISRQVSHMTNLIDDLLDVARVTRGIVVLQKEPLDFRQLLSEAEEQVTPLITARKHVLLRQIPPEPVPVMGDRKRLIQAVVNILNNAAKYTPEGGRIVVRLQMLADDAVLEITDNGIGMAPQMVLRVFDLFVQAERAADRSQGGLGLGLALVRSLVASHGGSVAADSDGLGRGSTFTVRLPLLQSEAVAPAGGPGPRVALATGALRVLVVDDNTDAACMLKMLLETMGYEVAVEYTAAGAIARAQALSPQVCLLDIGLPDMDGYELARRLKSRPATSAAVLIALTGYGQDQDRNNALAAGFDHHFVKPVDTSKLAALLAAISLSKSTTAGASR